MMPGPLALLAAQIGLSGTRNFFEGRDREEAVREAERINRARVSESNRINAFLRNPTHQVNLAQPDVRRSGITRALGVADVGLNVFRQGQQLKQLADDRAFNRKTGELQQEAAQAGIDRAAGQDASLAQGLPPSAKIGGTSAGGSRIAGSIGAVGRDNSQESLAFQGGFAGSQNALRDQRRGRQAADLGMKNIQSQIELRGAQTQRLSAPDVEKPKTRDMDSLIDWAAKQGKVNPGLDESAFLNLKTIKAEELDGGTLDGRERGFLFTAYLSGEQENEQQVNQFIAQERERFLSGLERDKTVQEAAEITRAIDFIMGGFENKSGFGDVQAIKMLARIQDPNSVVRNEEFIILMEAVSALDRGEIAVNKFFDGSRLTDEGRVLIMDISKDAYMDRKEAIDGIVGRRIKAMGDSGFRGEEQLNAWGDVFRLPAIDTKRFSLLRSSLLDSIKLSKPDSSSANVLQEAIRLKRQQQTVPQVGRGFKGIVR